MIRLWSLIITTTVEVKVVTATYLHHFILVTCICNFTVTSNLRICQTYFNRAVTTSSLTNSSWLSHLSSITDKVCYHFSVHFHPFPHLLFPISYFPFPGFTSAPNFTIQILNEYLNICSIYFSPIHWIWIFINEVMWLADYNTWFSGEGIKFGLGTKFFLIVLLKYFDPAVLIFMLAFL